MGVEKRPSAASGRRAHVAAFIVYLALPSCAGFQKNLLHDPEIALLENHRRHQVPDNGRHRAETARSRSDSPHFGHCNAKVAGCGFSSRAPPDQPQPHVQSATLRPSLAAPYDPRRCSDLACRAAASAPSFASLLTQPGSFARGSSSAIGSGPFAASAALRIGGSVRGIIYPSCWKGPFAARLLHRQKSRATNLANYLTYLAEGPLKSFNFWHRDR
jgi:hypothetical protein